MFNDKVAVLPFLSKLDAHMKEILHRASIAFVLKVAAAGLTFAFNVVLARLLGPHGAGLYFQVFTVATIAAVVGRLGLPNTLVRFTAGNAAVGEWGSVKGVYSKGMRFGLCGSLATAAGMFFLAPWLADSVFSNPELVTPIRWMSVAVVPFSVSFLYAQLLKGLRQIAGAISVESVSIPAFCLLGTIFLVPGWGVQGAIWAYAGASAICLLIGWCLWRRAAPQLRGIEGHFAAGELLRSSGPLLWMSILQLITHWSSTLMLSMWRSSADVGVFSVANRTAALTSFVLIAVNSIAAPKFAALYRKGDLTALGQTARNSAKLMSIMACPALVVFMLAPGQVMSIFGPQYEGGKWTLSILAAGQFVNVVTGSVGYLLMMCGHEQLIMKVTALSAFINIVLNAALIPELGVTGAAIADATTFGLQNLIMAWFVWRRLGIWTLPSFGIVGKPQRTSISEANEAPRR